MCLAAYVLATTDCLTQLINDGGWDATQPHRTEDEYEEAGKANNTEMRMVLERNDEGKLEIRRAAYFITGYRGDDEYLPVDKGEQAFTSYGYEFWPHATAALPFCDATGGTPEDVSDGGGPSDVSVVPPYNYCGEAPST